MELPRLKTIWEKHRDKGFVVIAVAHPYKVEEQQKYIAENSLPFTFLSEDKDHKKSMERDLYPSPGHPASWVIGRDGKVYYYHLGFEDGDEVKMEKEVMQLLKMK